MPGLFGTHASIAPLRARSRSRFTAGLTVAVALSLGVLAGPAARAAGQPASGAPVKTFAGLPDAPHAVVVNGAALACVDRGRGETIVLVHGSAEDYRFWKAQLGPLSKRYRVIAYSRRYHFPNSGGGDGRNYGVRLHEQDLAALIHSLGAGPVHLVGHSSGGTIAAQLAIDHPELVRTLVLAEPGLTGLVKDAAEATPELEKLRSAFSEIRGALAGGYIEPAIRSLIEVAFGEGADMALDPAIREEIVDNATALRMQMTATAAPPSFGCAEAKRITVPTLLLEGEKSPPLNHLIGEALAQCVPHAERATIKGAGHGMMFDRPREFNRAVLGFLARQGEAGARAGGTDDPR